MVEDLIHFKSISDRDLNRVRSAQRVEMECLLNTFSLEQCQSRTQENRGYLGNCVQQTETKRSILRMYVSIATKSLLIGEVDSPG